MDANENWANMAKTVNALKALVPLQQGINVESQAGAMVLAALIDALIPGNEQDRKQFERRFLVACDHFRPDEAKLKVEPALAVAFDRAQAVWIEALRTPRGSP